MTPTLNCNEVWGNATDDDEATALVDACGSKRVGTVGRVVIFFGMLKMAGG